jgi:hypothetical protein
MEMTAMVVFFPGCVFVRDAEATGCCTNPVIPSIPKWHRPRPNRAVAKCIGQIPIGTGWITTGWDQAQSYPRPTEQGRRIDVLALAPHREVERSPRRCDRITAANRGPSADQQATDEPVGRAEPTGVIDTDEQPPRDGTRECDHAVGGRPHQLADAGVVFDTPIARAVRSVGEPERIKHRGIGRWGKDHTRGARRRLRREREQQPRDENSNE